MEYVLLVVGFVLLIKGADFFVEGSSSLAQILKVPSVVIGLTIVDDSGVTIGKLENVIETGANDVYEVLTQDGGRVLLPAIKDCILDVDTEEGVILVHLLKGLVD